MCGRFAAGDMTQGQMTKIIEDFLYSERSPSYNIKPTQNIEIWTQNGNGFDAHMARWWLVPSWFKGDNIKEWKATTFNARIEDAANKPSFRGAWTYGRCLIPANGYYEWKGEKSPKQPYFIQPVSNSQHFYFAGLYSQWKDVLTCTILTRAANDSIKDVHHRMPVIPNSVEQDEWLAGEQNLEIGASTQLKSHRVAPFGRDDHGPQLIDEFDMF